MDVISELKSKRKEIAALIKQQQQREGEKASLLKRLKDEFNTDSLDGADKLLKKLDSELEECENGMVELVKEMDTIIQQSTVTK